MIFFRYILNYPTQSRSVEYDVPGLDEMISIPGLHRVKRQIRF